MYDLVTEQSALCSIMLSPQEAQGHIHNLKITEDSFHLEPHKIIFNTMTKLMAAGSPISAQTVWAEISGNGTFLNFEDVVAVEVLKEKNPYHWLDLLSKYHLARRMSSIMAGCQERIKKPFSVQEELTTVSEQLFHLQLESNKEEKQIELSDVTDDVGLVQSRLATINDKILGYPTGRPVVVAARPGMGKTTFACMEALDKAIIANGEGWYTYGEHVTIFSMEMSRSELMRKMTCMISGINERLVRQKLMTPEMKQKFAKYFMLVRDAPIMIYDRSHTPKQVVGNLRYQSEKNNTKFVVLDFFQRMRSRGRKDREFFSSASNEIADGLKAMPSEPAMIILSQLTREAHMDVTKPERERVVPRSSHLKETGSLEEDAYMIGLLSPIPATAHMVDDKYPMMINWDKNRGGGVGITKLLFHKSKQMFRDI